MGEFLAIHVKIPPRTPKTTGYRIKGAITAKIVKAPKNITIPANIIPPSEAIAKNGICLLNLFVKEIPIIAPIAITKKWITIEKY